MRAAPSELGYPGDMADPAEPSRVASGPRPGEPSFAERVRTLLHLGRTAALSTVSSRHGAAPFGSLVDYGVASDGSPTLFTSRLAMHTRNLLADPRASLLVAEPAEPGEELARGRATLVGRALPVGAGDLEQVRADYLARHEVARAWISFGDFSFLRLEVDEAYFVAGFGAMGWVPGEDLRAAAPDPLADDAAGIVSHMNEDHADALVELCRAYAGTEASAATMTGVDRLGLRVRVATADGHREVRISFPRAVATPEETRKAIVGMLRDARRADGPG